MFRERGGAVNLDDFEPVDVPIGPDGGEGIPGKTEWVARVHWDMAFDRLVPVAVTLLSEAGGPVTPEQWRKVRPAEIIRAATDLVTAGALLATLSADEAQREAAEVLVDLAAGTERGLGDAHYREVARVYALAVSTGDKAPRQAVRRHFRRQYPERFGALKETTVRGWVRTAQGKDYIKQTARPRRAQEG